ncbi:hypothetical protein INR49_004091 [Caranx melampygus]|nr:hypothetical protein INR49_004091 [Caranx melampygus]
MPDTLMKAGEPLPCSVTNCPNCITPGSAFIMCARQMEYFSAFKYREGMQGMTRDVEVTAVCVVRHTHLSSNCLCWLSPVVEMMVVEVMLEVITMVVVLWWGSGGNLKQHKKQTVYLCSESEKTK